MAILKHTEASSDFETDIVICRSPGDLHLLCIGPYESLVFLALRELPGLFALFLDIDPSYNGRGLGDELEGSDFGVEISKNVPEALGFREGTGPGHELDSVVGDAVVIKDLPFTGRSSDLGGRIASGGQVM
jgi:hypothetical protein